MYWNNLTLINLNLVMIVKVVLVPNLKLSKFVKYWKK